MKDAERSFSGNYSLGLPRLFCTRNALLKRIKGTPYYFPYIAMLTTQSLIPILRQPTTIQNVCFFASCENYLEVTDYKNFDTRNFLPKTIGNLFKNYVFPETDKFFQNNIACKLKTVEIRLAKKQITCT